DKYRIFVHAGVDPNCSLDEQAPQDLIWKIYDDRDEGGHGQRHIVHGHHQHADGPILKKNRTNLDTFAWYTGRLVMVFSMTTCRVVRSRFGKYRAHRCLQCSHFTPEKFERSVPNLPPRLASPLARSNF